MPLLTPQQKQQLLASRGLDFNTWDIDETTMTPYEREEPSSGDSMGVTIRPDSSPSVSPLSFDNSKKTSTAGAFGKSFLQAAPSALGSGVGAALGVALAPETGGLSFLLPLLGALGGGYGVGKAQQAIEPQGWQQSVAEAQKEHPVAGTLGGLSAIPLGGFAPSPTNLGRAGGTALKLLTGAPREAGEMANLANVGIGAGINTGIDVAHQLMSPEPFSIPQMLESAGVGALFNRPNTIGRRLGFQPAEVPSIHDILRGELVPMENRTGDLTATPPGISLEDITAAGGLPYSRPQLRSGPLRNVVERSGAMAKYKQTPEPTAAEVARMESEGGQPTIDREELAREQALEAERQQKIKDFQLAKQELADSELERQTAELQQQIEANRIAAKEVRTKPLATTETGKDIMPDYTGVTEQANKEVAQESSKDLEMRRSEGLQDKYSEESQLNPARTQLQKESLPELKKYAPTRKWFDLLKDFGINIKGIAFDNEGTPINSKTGKPVAGQTILEQGIPRLVKLNLSGTGPQAGADTPVHELFHAFVASLRKSERPYDQKLVREYDNIVSKSDDYQQWKRERESSGLESSPEEYQATNAGYQFLKTHLNLSGEKPLRKWFNDFGSYLKTRFSKHATEEDYRRLLDYRLTNEQKPFSKYFGESSSAAVPRNIPVTEKQQEEQPELFNVKDVKASSKFAKMREAAEGDERIIKQAEKEDIRNAENKLSEKSELAQTNDSVRQISGDIKILISGLEEDKISPTAAVKARESLKSNFNWKDLPKTKAFIYDQMRPENALSWRALHRMYLSEVAERREVPTAAEETPTVQKNEPTKEPAPAKKEPNAKKAPLEYESRGIAKSRPISSEQLDERIKQFPKISPEKLEQERRNTEIEWKEVDNTKTPKTLAKQLRDRYQQALAYKEQLQREGYKFDSPEMQLNRRRLDGLKLKYDVLRDKRGIAEPPIDATDITEYESERSMIPYVLQPEVEKIRKLENPEAPKVADALSQFYSLRRRYTGYLTNDFLSNVLPYIPKTNLKGQFLQNVKDFNDVVQRRFDMQDYGRSNVKLSPAAQEIDNILTENLQRSLDLKNRFPALRGTLEGNPEYLPHIPSSETLDTLLNHSGTPEAKKLIDDWYDYYTRVLGESRESAKDNLKIFMGGYKKQEVNLAQQFGPIDKAAGLGLPRSWRRQSLVDIMSHFNNRYGRRIAYHEAVETNPEAMAALTNDEGGIGAADVVKNVMNDVSGVRENDEAKRTAISGIVRAAMLGPLTGSKDFVSNLTLGMQHQTLPQSILSPLKAWSEIGKNIKESFAAGVNRYNIAAIEMGESGGSNFTNILRRVRDVISTGQGRNFLEKITRATAYGQGKFIAMDNLWAAHNRTLSSQGKKFLNDFAPENWRDYVGTGEFPEDILQEIAAKYVESVQGTYDYRGLPSIAQKGTFAPYLALARWNIEKLNNFDKHVVQPALNGNITPLLMSTLGMVIGGEAVNQLVQAVTKRKEKTPTYQELVALSEEPEAKTTEGVLYKLAGLASLSGYAGIVGDLTKAAGDLWFKNRPQTYNNPLISGAESVGANMLDAVDAMRNGDLNIGAGVLSQVLEDFFQAYRIGLAQLSPEKQSDITTGNKLRDLKLFKSMTGQPVSEATSDRANPFENTEMRQFKKTADFQESADLLPSLLQKAFEKAGNNPELLMRELQKLKRNSYQTMPSPENMPASFIRYLTYLQRERGPEEASNVLQDYLLRNTINKAKSELIPSL